MIGKRAGRRGRSAYPKGNAMSNVIDFLERMGADASLRTATPDHLARELAEAAVEDDAAQAIVSGDALALRHSIAPGVFYAILMEDEPEEQQDQEDDEEASVHLRRHTA